MNTTFLTNSTLRGQVAVEGAGATYSDEHGERRDPGVSMDERLVEALAPVLRDARSTVGVTPEIVDEPWSDFPGRLSALMRTSDAIWGIGVMANGSSAQRVVEAADAVQVWVIEQLWGRGRVAAWPQCPEHPDTHPLAPQVRDAVPVWVCPRGGSVAFEIGALNS